MTDLLRMVPQAFWETASKMAPWLLFGFLAAGLLSLFFTPETVSRHLGRRAGWRAGGRERARRESGREFPTRKGAREIRWALP